MPPPRSFPIRSRCCCRCRAAPKRSASPCATGFIAAYLEQDPASRPHLKIYDVAAESVAGAYRHAIDEGAGFVVGPLTKEDVAAIAPLSGGRTPVLALNFLADSVSAAPQFLSIRAVARG